MIEKVTGSIGFAMTFWGLIWGMFVPSFLWLALAGIGIFGVMMYYIAKFN